tara:strand:+ start:77 stop:577 length:501 start_codon:yes stop_codon:yes gene_type:complete
MSSLIAGALSALGASAGKAGSALLASSLDSLRTDGRSVAALGGAALAVLLLAAMVVANGAALGYQLRGLRSSSALLGTARNFGANFVCSAALGVIFWGERALGTVTWCAGAALIVSGIALLGGEEEKEEEEASADGAAMQSGSNAAAAAAAAAPRRSPRLAKKKVH